MWQNFSQRMCFIVLVIVLFCMCTFLFGCADIKAPAEPTGRVENNIVLFTKAPSSEAPVSGESPSKNTAALNSGLPEETQAPVNSAALDTSATETKAPVTEVPITEAPITEVPITEAPSTAAPYKDTFMDVNAVKNIYLTPGEKIFIEDGVKNPEKWISDNESVIKLSVEDGKLAAEALKTGSAVLKNTDGSGEEFAAHSMLAAPRTDSNKVIDGFKYYLYYEKGSHTLTVYTADDEGYYTVPVRTICAACGSTPAKTPTGIHKLGEKLRWKEFSKTCYAQYGIAYASGVWLHSTCYSETRESSVLSHYYNTIGENSTGGCIRMQVGHVYWIYENCPEGTLLEIVNGNPRETSSVKPADIPEAACYDPTDPVLNK